MYLEKELSEIVSIPSVTSNIIESKRCIDYCLNFVKKDINSDKLFVEQREFNGFHSMLISNPSEQKLLSELEQVKKVYAQKKQQYLKEVQQKQNASIPSVQIGLTFSPDRLRSLISLLISRRDS